MLTNIQHYNKCPKQSSHGHSHTHAHTHSYCTISRNHLFFILPIKFVSLYLGFYSLICANMCVRLSASCHWFVSAYISVCLCVFFIWLTLIETNCWAFALCAFAHCPNPLDTLHQPFYYCIYLFHWLPAKGLCTDVAGLHRRLSSFIKIATNFSKFPAETDARRTVLK